ncbi:MAG: hypothetical protein H6672_03075 [Anaerolineaceae bacterium]|nr:hypothetical protein [Anaerolineaceae bacterium]
MAINQMNMKWLLTGVRLTLTVALLVVLLGNPFFMPTALAACTITGTVYREYNASGNQDQREPGELGVTVTAYDETGAVVATAVTDANGNYTLVIGPVVPNGDQVRVEFEVPTDLFSGPFGAESDTTVTFVTCAGAVAGVDLGVNTLGDFCHLTTPDLATSCYVLGDQINNPAIANNGVFIGFPYNASGDDPHTNLAVASEVGTTFGLAYHRSTDTYFLAGFIKRHTGLGPNATGTATTTGGIYKVARNGPVPGSANLFLDLNTLGAAFSTGADPHPTSDISCGVTALPGGCWQYDPDTWPVVGKVGIGDIEMSSDDQTLWVVNLFQRELIEIPVGEAGVVPPVAQMRRYSLAQGNLPGLTCPSPNDVRPFGIGVREFNIYVGVVCTAESTQNRADMRGFVYELDSLNPGTGFQKVLDFALDYPRRCADAAPACFANRAADWRPWTNVWQGAAGGGDIIYPEPWITDIVFDSFGNMIIGMRDRMGDRIGKRQARPDDLTSLSLYQGVAAGDILRACTDPLTPGTWTLEDNGTCGGITTGGANNTQGPDIALVGGEYYFQDDNNYDGVEPERHDEITLGGLLVVPGRGDVAVTVFDPLPEIPGPDNRLFDGGVIWLNNDDVGGAAPGERTRALDYRIFDSQFGAVDGLFGKSNGLGDLEAVCGLQPLEIGNRVWEDLDQNGRQDPNEMVLAGVTVSLYDATGVLIATTVTNAVGEYYFNEGNVFDPADPRTWHDANGDGLREANEPAGILANITYEIRLDSAANYGGGPLTPYYATVYNNDMDMRDSNGIVPNPASLVTTANYPRYRLTTDLYGMNNHTYDFGFSLFPPPTPTPRATPQTTGDLPTFPPQVTELPETGQSTSESLRLPLLALGIGLLGLGAWFTVRRSRRQNGG